MKVKRPELEPYTCEARPAAKGARCGFHNADGGIAFMGVQCCAECGCTRKASDDRRLAT